MRNAPLSLRTQLMVWNAVILALLLTALGTVTRFAAASAILHSVDQSLQERTRPPGRPGPPDGPPQFRGEPHGDFFRPPGPPGRDDRGDRHHPRLFDAQGQPRRPAETAWDPGALLLALHGQTVFSTATGNGEPLRVLSQPTRDGGAVQAAYPLTEVRRALAGLDRALLLLPLALLGAGAGGALLTGRVPRPVRQMTQAAARMGDVPSACLPAPDAAERKDEFGELAATFNGLLDRLEGSFQAQARLLAQQRRFTADASHELKTPITVIQGTASQLGMGGMSAEERQQAASEIMQAAGSMARLVQDLLLLARSDEGRLARNPISVLAREVLTQAASRVPPDGPPVSLHLAEDFLLLRGNQEELVRLFANLLQNAARATPADGKITVSAERQGAEVAVTVADTGTGMASQHLPHLGERFYRADSARARQDGGTGLGLSICRSIAEAHGGTLSFASAPGRERR